jgi:glycosyltransferase involved in cell wall biosynthesis
MAKILYLTGMLPLRMANGTEIATRMIADTLREIGHQVVMFGYARPDDPLPSSQTMVTIDRRTIEFAEASTRQKAAWAAEALLRREPLSISKYRRPLAMALLDSRIAKGVDGVLIDKPQMLAVFRRHLHGLPVSVVWHAIEHQTYAAVARDSKGWQQQVYRREARLAKRMETRLLPKVNHVFTLTPADAEALKQLGYHGAIDVAPMIVPATTAQQVNTTEAFAYDIGLLGNWTWAANASGLEWFLRAVRPLLPAHLSIAIGGRGAATVAPEVSTVSRVGYVDDARIFLAQCRVVAVPLKAGTGVSMKVLEAACAGWPTVTTAIGARGIGSLPANVQVADTASEFASALHVSSLIPRDLRHAWSVSGARWMHDRRRAFAQALQAGIGHLTSQRDTPLPGTPLPGKPPPSGPDALPLRRMRPGFEHRFGPSGVITGRGKP